MEKSKTLFRIDVGGDFVLKKETIRNHGGVSSCYEEIGACGRTRLVLENDTDIDVGLSGCEYFISPHRNGVDGYRGTINRGRS